MDWRLPPADFCSVTLERVNPAKAEARFYYLGWQPTLFGDQAMVRIWGRKSGRRRSLARPFASLDAAWPAIRACIKTRLRHGYRIVEPGEYQAYER
jgi:predicted DNA-binding WGR domain protein